MQGTPQSTTESIHDKRGASHEWTGTLPPRTHAPPGEQPYRHASGRAFSSLVISITALPVNWIVFINTMASNTYLNIDLGYPHSIMPFVSFLGWVFGPTGLVLGIQGFQECNRTPGLKGRTPAILGVILSSMTIIFALVATIWTAFTLAEL